MSTEPGQLQTVFFKIDGGGGANGGDINYIGIGALAAAYGFERRAVVTMVITWNWKQYSDTRETYNLNQIPLAAPWALRGYDDYKANSGNY